MNVIAEFLLWFAAAEAIVIAAQLPFRKKTRKPVGRALLIAGKALLGIAFGALVLAGPVQLRPVQPLMTGLYAALLADAAGDALYRGAQALRKKERRFRAARAAGLACGALFVVFGILNMETVTPKYHTYTSEKLSRAYTAAFIADLHVGSAQPFSVTEKTVAAVRAENPDFTVLGGDIVDDYTTKEEMEATFALFAGFETPVYYIYGNHDRQGYAEYAGGRKFTAADLEAAAAANGVTVLKDEFAVLGPDLVLLGRRDLSEKVSRAATQTLINPVPEAFLLVADHQPNAFREHAAYGADLQLSGHTHAGQLFPLRALYMLIGPCYGDYTEGGAVMNVSAGACGWRFPLRTDAGCHYEVVELEPTVASQ